MKTNKQIIESLRDNAELAWASYGFFDRGEYDDGSLAWREKTDKEKSEVLDNKHQYIKITYPDILTNDFKDLEAYHNIPDDNGEYQPIKPFYKKSKFQGDMGREHAMSLLSDDKGINQVRKAKYTLIYHIPNTFISGFSATIFYDKIIRNISGLGKE